jgi:hypothetical protein
MIWWISAWVWPEQRDLQSDIEGASPVTSERAGMQQVVRDLLVRDDTASARRQATTVRDGARACHGMIGISSEAAS